MSSEDLQVPAEPERRSAADLQKILDSLIGDRSHVLSKDLPSALREYERKHAIVILEPADYVSLEALCEEHGDIPLGPQEMFGFLSLIPKSIRPASPPPSLPHSASLPPTAFREAEDTPRQQRKRRESDRIRSPSDVSSSSDDDASGEEVARRRAERQTSAPPIGLQSPDIFSDQPYRKKTLSDASRHPPPRLGRQRHSAGPPSAFGMTGGFARPSPASRRRRGSASDRSANGEEEEASSNQSAKTFGRSVSWTSSIGGMPTSPPWPAYARSPSQPGSPYAAGFGVIDAKSFHRARTPDVMVGSEADVSELAMDDDDDHEEILDETEDVDGGLDQMGQGMLGDSISARLGRLPTESSNSLRSSHDKLRALQKTNTELARKLKESETQLSVIGAENERLVEDLQDKLEEARAEISQRRKDEKDMKGKERALLIQISGFEADIAGLTKSLEAAKENHANMQKMYTSQVDEAQRLRGILRDRDTEIQSLEESAQGHAADEAKLSREVQALEAEIKRLETDLRAARQAEAILETQKQENLQLKETIDRMRFELDEARATAAVAVHTRGVTASSGPVTLSRNLGDEISRRLVDAQNGHSSTGTDGSDQEDGEEVIETVVTTRQTRRKGTKAVTTVLTPEETGQEVGESGPSVIDRLVLEVQEAADDETATAGPSLSSDSNSAGENPPAYTREPEPLNKQELLEEAHPCRHGVPSDADDTHAIEEAYDAVVRATGSRCLPLEEKLERRRKDRAKRGMDELSGASQSVARSRRRARSGGLVDSILTQTIDPVNLTGKVAAVTMVAFAIGLFAGSAWFSTAGGLNTRDLQLFTQMNTLAATLGTGEGFLPFGQKGVSALGDAARVLAGRVPS